MKSYSQAGQDLFVDAVLNGRRNGVYLDIGCNHPILNSNTYALETELGWTGWLFDSNSQYIAECREKRKGRASYCDARTYDFCLNWGNREDIAYLSLDTDECQAIVLENLLNCATSAKVKFEVLTVETDRYRFGRHRRAAVYGMLQDAGYLCIAHDVMDNGCIFESYWVDPTIEANMERARPFISSGLDWREMLRQGGVMV